MIWESYLVSIVRRLLDRVGKSADARLDGVCTPAELDAAVRRERSRSDRTGGRFAVVRFLASTCDRNRRALLPLANHLRLRSRSIDDLGWSRENHLCLILAECQREHATSLAATLCRDFSTEELTLTYALYFYSATKSPTPPQREQPRGLPSISNEAVTLSTAELPASRHRQGCHAAEPIGSEPIESEPIGSEPSHSCTDAAPMNVLLVREMPWWKRSLDIGLSAIAFILLAPLLAVIAIAIRISSPGPILFQQLRTGRGGRPFLLYKFRSMTSDAELQKGSLMALNEQDGPAFKMEQDPRVTSVGRILRALSLDELPQLWNVLRGEMSIVGPRPLPVDEAEACENWQRQRTDVTPGLTCFWQVKDRRAKIPFVEWVRMDIRYIASQSLWTDLWLVAQTALFIIRRKGV